MTAICAHGVAKAFGRRTVLAAVELELAGPGLVRFEGANGAVRVADGTAAIVTGDERVRIRTGPATAQPLPGAERDGEGWLAELPRAEAQEAPATLLAAEIEVREVRPLR